MTMLSLKQIPSKRKGATDMSLMLPALNRNFIGRPALSTVTLIFVVLPPLLFPMCCVSPFLRPSLVGGGVEAQLFMDSVFCQLRKSICKHCSNYQTQGAERAKSFQFSIPI